MAHEPRVFVAPHQTPEKTGHALLVFNGTSPSLASILSNTDLRELTASEYTQWDGGNKTYNSVRSHL
jgi:hypothetical protein